MSVTLTFLGHSGFLIDTGDGVIAIDPFLTGNPVATMTADEVDCRWIVATHAHDDHFVDVIPIAARTGATLYGGFELCEYAGAKGINAIEPMNPGGRVAAPFGFVAMTHAVHSSSFSGTNLGVACGAIMKIGDVTIYHCGDTDLFGDMKLIGEIYRPDVALIPIGDRFTMGPELATRAAELICPRIAIPVHYNTWPPIAQDPAQFKPAGVEVRVLAPGGSTHVS